jgi:hypothetical protein
MSSSHPAPDQVRERLAHFHTHTFVVSLDPSAYTGLDPIGLRENQLVRYDQGIDASKTWGFSNADLDKFVCEIQQELAIVSTQTKTAADHATIQNVIAATSQITWHTLVYGVAPKKPAAAALVIKKDTILDLLTRQIGNNLITAKWIGAELGIAKKVVNHKLYKWLKQSPPLVVQHAGTPPTWTVPPTQLF